MAVAGEVIDFNEQAIGFDLETQGTLSEYALQPWRAESGQAWVSAAAYTKGETTAGNLFPSATSITAVLEAAANKNLYVCGWNVSFDCSWLIALGREDLAFQIKWLDSMLLWRHLCVEPESDDTPPAKKKRWRLEDAMHEFFPDQAGFKEFKNFQTQDQAELQQLLFRCREDTRFAVRLGEMFWHKLSPRQQQAALIEARCIPQVARANVKGLWSSREAAEKLQAKLEADGAAARAKLLELSPEAETVNLGSPMQLATLIYDTWGLPCDRMTKGTKTKPEGSRSTDKYALYELAFRDPRAKLLKEVREAKGNNTKYAVATQKCLDYNGDGFLRPGAKIFSTYSSRMTYSSSQKRRADKELGTKSAEFQTGVALHQWKRGKDFRRLIRPPEGFGLCELDFAGQEFGWMAVASMDETMLSLREPGEDAHSYMGAQIAQIDYKELVARVAAEDAEASFQRKLGKFANLSFQYRVGPKTALMKARTDYEMDLDELFIKQILATYKATYTGVAGAPGVIGYWAKAIYKAKMAGYAETFAGRRVQLKGSWAGREAWPMESTAINYPIQGTGGDQKYLALAVARNMLPTWGGYVYYELHDGLFFIFPLDKLQKAAETFRTALSNLPYKQAWGINLPITFPVDAKISAESWGDLKSI